MTTSTEPSGSPRQNETTKPPTPAHNQPTTRHTHRPDIQGLRALAVLLVILNHAGVTQLSGGYTGVDIFFVISGYLITTSLLHELTTTNTTSIKAFYARRALRLLPAATLVILTTLTATWFFLPKARFTQYATDALSSALYTLNYRLAHSGTDYLAQDSPPTPFQHFWSLAVEEQFYLIWPLLLLATWRASQRPRLRHAPLTVLALLTGISFALSATLTTHSAPWAYFGAHTRIWELGAGALLAHATPRLRHLPAHIAAPMTWAGLTCVLLAATQYNADTPFPGTHALLPVLGATLILAGGCSPTRYDARTILATKPATWLGTLSYSWYLWHWPLLLITPQALIIPTDIPVALTCSAIALLLAWATLHLIENPIRFHTTLRNRPTRAIHLGLALTALAATSALIAAHHPPPIHTTATAPPLRETLDTAPDPQKRLTELLETSPAGLPNNLTPALHDIKNTKSALYKDGCHQNYSSTHTPRCVYGDPTSETTVVLLGDSHAAQWFPALSRLAHQHRWKLIPLTKAACKIPAITTLNHNRPYTTCDTWRTKALAEIKRIHPTLVITSSSDAGIPAHTMNHPLEEWTAGYRETFRTLTTPGTRVTALLDTPWPSTDAVDCASTYPLRLSRCDHHLPDAIRDHTRRTATRTAAASTGTRIIDPQPWLCTPTGTCPILAGNTLTYRDAGHISETYAEALAPLLGNQLLTLHGTDLRG